MENENKQDIIKTKELTFDYIRHDEEGNEEGAIRAVDGVNLEVKPGDFIAILGHNGSGKSTLAKHINALLVPTSGTICGWKNHFGGKQYMGHPPDGGNGVPESR